MFFSYDDISEEVINISGFFKNIEKDGSIFEFDQDYCDNLEYADIKLCLGPYNDFINNYSKKLIPYYIIFCHGYDISNKLNYLLMTNAYLNVKFDDNNRLLNRVLERNKYYHMYASLNNAYVAIEKDLPICLNYCLLNGHNEACMSYIEYAIVNKSYECLKMLIYQKFKIDKFAIEQAGQAGCLEILKYLKEKCDVKFNYYCLKYAEMKNYEDCVEYIKNNLEL